MSANPRIKVEEADSTLFVPVEQSEKQYQYLLFLYLRYESSTLILYKELSSPIYRAGIGNTCPNLHFVQYRKAEMPSTDILRYKSSTFILYTELSSSFFQSL